MKIKRKRGLDHSAVGSWTIRQKGTLKKGPSLIIGIIYDGSIERSKEIVRGKLLKVVGDIAYLITKDSIEVKVIKNTLQIVC